MPTSTQLAEMRDTDITGIDRSLLIDIDNVNIDTSLTAVQKIESLIKQIKNPYCFLCGDTPVKIRFVSQCKTMANSLESYFTSLK